ncbi:MAG TPA: hypothetical protein VE619_06390 [Nitrososphaeraceae archaeon]|nr:hypothetical protein [Nitrososphaeraceae archaeon]
MPVALEVTAGGNVPVVIFPRALDIDCGVDYSIGSGGEVDGFCPVLFV